MMRTVNEIIIHCTATPEGKEVTTDEIRRYHVNVRGWNDIGYHYIIGLDGKISEGRNIEKAGAHCKGHNANSIGVAYVGGVSTDGKTPKDTRTASQKKSLLKLLKTLVAKFPGAKIHSHRDFAAKACPSFDATREYSNILKVLILIMTFMVSSCKSKQEIVNSKVRDDIEKVSYGEINTSDSIALGMTVAMDSLVITTIVQDTVLVRVVAHRPIFVTEESAIKKESLNMAETESKKSVNAIESRMEIKSRQPPNVFTILLTVTLIATIMMLIRKIRG